MKLSDSEFQLHKTKIISNLISKFAITSGNAIVFCQRKADAMLVSNRLNDDGRPNEALHGDVPQVKR